MTENFYYNNNTRTISEKRLQWGTFGATPETRALFEQEKKRNNFFDPFSNHLFNYPTHINLNYAWGFGSLAGFYLVIQIVTGLILASHYTASAAAAFDSVEHIMRNVNDGWMFRYMHANGASFFFIMIYCHMARNLFYTSYAQPREGVWYTGLIIFFLSMATAFTGYVLPWGQMSYWGCTVICKLFTAIPLVGDTIVSWLWGGPVVNNATLKRFFIFHFLLPFVISGFVLLHLDQLHKVGSGNPLGVENGTQMITFYPYYFIKDLHGICISLIFYFYFTFHMPNYLGHPDNYIKADPMKTPAHIVPEWYFLPFYAILRSIPDKLLGVLAMFSSIIVLFFLPILNKSQIRSLYFKPVSMFLYFCFIGVFFVLGWIGQQPVREPFITSGQIATFFYFFYLTVITYTSGLFEGKSREFLNGSSK